MSLEAGLYIPTVPRWRCLLHHKDLTEIQTLPRESQHTSLHKQLQIETDINPLKTSAIKTSLLMFYTAKVAVCSEIRTKHENAIWAPRRIF
jgi:hypothetical protein